MEKFSAYAKREILGQDRAIELISSALERFGSLSLFDGVAGMLTMAGPPACGKNFAAKVIGRYLQREMLILHMGDYAYSDDIERLVGEKGVLERWIAAHPDGVVIFEDIDKADHSIQRLLASIVSDGAPDDLRRYKESLFLFTFSVNDPSWYEKRFIDEYYDNPLLVQGKFYEQIAKEAVTDEEGNLTTVFDADILTVFSEGDLALFYPLEFKVLHEICERVMQKSVTILNAGRTTVTKIEHPRECALAFLLGFSPYLNAKRIAHKLPALITDMVSKCPGDAKLCRIRVSKNGLKQLEPFFDLSEEIKHFVKFERSFELEWKESRRGSGITLTLTGIVERELQKPEERPAYSDRLAIRVSHIGFDDVAGQLRVKKELKSIIRLLQDETGLEHFGISLPKGLLLYGPEGVGKSMLVKAFAKEAGLAYLYLGESDLFDEMLIREVFTRARLAAPVLVVLEGVDTKGVIEGNYTSIPTGLLTQMIDRIPSEPGEYIFTIATARDIDEVPTELMRPGRLDQSVEVPELDREARRFFAKKILEKPHEKGISVERITRYMSGMNGYELGRIAKEASLDALRAGLSELTEEIIIDRINTIKYGHKLEKRRFKNFEEDLKKSAYHEAAHAVASLRLLPDVEIEQVTVIPRSEALGLVSYMQDAIETNLSKEEIEANIAVLLAGRVATVKKFGPEKGLETGAYSDLQEASLYAYSAVAQFGMDEELPNIHIETLLQNINSNLFREKIESRIIYWMEEGTRLATKVVEKEWKMIETVALRLLKEELIEGEELKRYLKGDLKLTD
ncbi:cell division protein FtsH [Hydrogenimonas sp.]|nr:cell division protein FtsH [Hydrogenimonas sp.]